MAKRVGVCLVHWGGEEHSEYCGTGGMAHVAYLPDMGPRRGRRFCGEAAPGARKPVSGQTLRTQPHAQCSTAQASARSMVCVGQGANGPCRVVLHSQPAGTPKLPGLSNGYVEVLNPLHGTLRYSLHRAIPRQHCVRARSLQGAVGALCKLLATPNHEVR